MKGDRKYNKYIIRCDNNGQKLTYKDLKKKITKENKIDQKEELRVINKELMKERKDLFVKYTMIGVGAAISAGAVHEGTRTGDISITSIGTGLSLLTLTSAGIVLLNPKFKEKKEKIKNLKNNKKIIKESFKRDLENKLFTEREFIDNHKPYVKTKTR